MTTYLVLDTKRKWGKFGPTEHYLHEAKSLTTYGWNKGTQDYQSERLLARGNAFEIFDALGHLLQGKSGTERFRLFATDRVDVLARDSIERVVALGNHTTTLKEINLLRVKKELANSQTPLKVVS